MERTEDFNPIIMHVYIQCRMSADSHETALKNAKEVAEASRFNKNLASSFPEKTNEA